MWARRPWPGSKPGIRAGTRARRVRRACTPGPRMDPLSPTVSSGTALGFGQWMRWRWTPASPSRIQIQIRWELRKVGTFDSFSMEMKFCDVHVFFLINQIHNFHFLIKCFFYSLIFLKQKWSLKIFPFSHQTLEHFPSNISTLPWFNDLSFRGCYLIWNFLLVWIYCFILKRL